MIRRPPRSTRTDTLFPYRRSSDLLGEAVDARFGGGVIDLAILPRLAVDRTDVDDPPPFRSEEHTSELQSLMRISYAVFCLKKKKITNMEHEIKYDEKKDMRNTDIHVT